MIKAVVAGVIVTIGEVRMALEVMEEARDGEAVAAALAEARACWIEMSWLAGMFSPMVKISPFKVMVSRLWDEISQFGAFKLN